MPSSFSVDVEVPDEPVTFTIRGKHRLTGAVWEEEFRALPAIPVGVLADLGNGIMPATDAARFISALLIEEDVDRFDWLIRDKDRILNEVAMANIVTRLFTAITGRPTEPPASSPSGAAATGTTSTGG